MDIVIKRTYDSPSDDDGYRVLVDRLWPRGIKKELLQIDEWNKDITPSTELRRWFGHDPNRFEEFAVQYRAELDKSGEAQKLLSRTAGNKRRTLLYSAKDPKINHAIILQKYLKSHQN